MTEVVVCNTKCCKKDTQSVPYHVCLLYSLSLAVSGLFVSWDNLSHLSYSETVSVLVCMYITLSCVFLSLAEMASVLPFTSGAAGFTRVSLGSFWGFSLGIGEVIQGMLYISIMLYDFTDIIYFVFDFKYEEYRLLIFLLTLLVAFSIKRIGFHFSYHFSFLFGILVIILWCVYVVSDLIRLKDFQSNSLASYTSSTYIFRRVKDPLWFFFNLSILPVHCRHTENPKKNVPRILLTTLVFIIFISFITITLYYLNGHNNSDSYTKIVLAKPLITNLFPDGSNKQSEYILILCLLPLFLNIFSYFISQSLMVSSLAESGFIPQIFGLDLNTGFPTWKTDLILCAAYLGIVSSSLIDHQYRDIILLELAAGTFFIYCLEMVSCFAFMKKFSSLKREFTSPLGKYSPAFAFYFTGFLYIVTFIFDPLRDSIIISFIVYFVFIVLMYNFYSRHNQKFSEIEQKTLFAAYVINANVAKHKNKKMKRILKEKSKFQIQFELFSKNFINFLNLLANPWQENHKFAENMELDKDILNNVPSIHGSSSNTTGKSLSEISHEDSGDSSNTSQIDKHNKSENHSILDILISVFRPSATIIPINTSNPPHKLAVIDEFDNRLDIESNIPSENQNLDPNREIFKKENSLNVVMDKDIENTLNRETILLD